MKHLIILLALICALPCFASDYINYKTCALAGVSVVIPTAAYVFYKKYNIDITDINVEETPGADLSAEEIMNQFDIMETRTETELRTGYPNGLSDRELASLVVEEEKYHIHKAQYWKLIQLQRQQDSRLREQEFMKRIENCSDGAGCIK